MSGAKLGFGSARAMLFILAPAGIVMLLRPEFLGGFLLLYLVAAAYFRLDSRLSVGAGLVYLLLCLVLTLARQNGLAAAAADTAFVFFAVGVVSAVVEYTRSARETSA